MKSRGQQKAKEAAKARAFPTAPPIVIDPRILAGSVPPGPRTKSDSTPVWIVANAALPHPEATVPAGPVDPIPVVRDLTAMAKWEAR
jgi:hypothetical protein